MALTAVTIAGALAIFLSQSASAAGSYTLVPARYGMQLSTPDGRVVFEYMTKMPENIGLISNSAACFHPVNTPSGERVTSIAPDDHPHHRGIMMTWHDAEFHDPGVVKADFWFGPGQSSRAQGRVIENREVRLAGADATRARIEIQNEWTIDKRGVMSESDTAMVAERNGVYVLDLDYRLTPGSEYVLNHNAFGGFAVQGRKDGEWTYSNAAGKVPLPDPKASDPALNWPDAPWYDYTIRVKDSDKIVGVAVMGHPQNPPTTWHNVVWMLNPTLAAAGPLTIAKGTTLRQRYRVVTHDGPPPVKVLDKLAAEWRATN